MTRSDPGRRQCYSQTGRGEKPGGGPRPGEGSASASESVFKLEAMVVSKNNKAIFVGKEDRRKVPPAPQHARSPFSLRKRGVRQMRSVRLGYAQSDEKRVAIGSDEIIREFGAEMRVNILILAEKRRDGQLTP